MAAHLHRRCSLAGGPGSRFAVRRGYGQLAMFSYDNGSSWSTNWYEIHKGGLYAQSVVLKSGEIVTATAVYPGDAGDPGHNTSKTTLHALRWRTPPRAEVEKGGFMQPLIPPAMFDANGSNLIVGGCTIH